MSDNLVAEFNRDLVERDVRMNIRAYINRINGAIFKEDIDGFADDLLDLVIRDEFSVPHTHLIKYKVIAQKNAGANVLRMLLQYGLEEGKDFQSSTLKTGNHGGSAPKMYYLRPRAFEKCLMCAKKTHRYADFYSLLRECIASYDKYQIALRDRVIAGKDGTIARLSEQLRELSSQTGELLGATREIKQQNVCMSGRLTEVKAQNTAMLSGIHDIKESSNSLANVAQRSLAMLEVTAGRHVVEAADRALPPEDPARSDSVILLDLDGTKYVVLRIQARYVTSTLRDRRKKHPNLREVLHFRDVPNSKYLWTRSREILGDRIRIDLSSYITFTLEQGTDEADVIEVMEAVRDEPTDRAEGASTFAKTWATTRRTDVKTAKDRAARTVTIVETVTTTTKTSIAGDAETEAWLDELLN